MKFTTDCISLLPRVQDPRIQDHSKNDLKNNDQTRSPLH